MKALGLAFSWVGVWLVAVGIGHWSSPMLVYLALLTYGLSLVVRFFEE